MNALLLDTNIVIYLLNSDSVIAHFIEEFKDASFYISIVTWIEALAGSHQHNKSIDDFTPYLDQFIRLPMDLITSKIAAGLLQNTTKKYLFQDAVIAATALSHRMPLITNNPKDFRKFKGLKVISPKKVRSS